MLALVALTALFAAVLYALGQVRGAAPAAPVAAVVPSIQRGVAVLARAGDAWRPVEHLRG